MVACFCWCLEWSGNLEKRGAETGERKVEIWSDASGSWCCGVWSHCRLLGVNSQDSKYLPLRQRNCWHWLWQWRASWRGKVVLCHCDKD